MAITLDTVETPVAVVDLARARANAERVASYCKQHRLNWRPHTKTHKTPQIGAIQCAAGAAGLTVATPREAEVMQSVSHDLLLAYPAFGDEKIARLLDLDREVVLRVALDSEIVLEAMARAAAARGRELSVLVEIDLGARRVGVETPEQAVALARRARELHGTRFSGIMFHPGHIASGDNSRAQIAELRTNLDRFLGALASANLSPEIVSGGNTPSLWHSHELPQLTEIRAGTHIFNDRDSVACGAASWDDVAYSVLATVVSVSVSGQAVIDAGSKALAKEILSHSPGFGLVMGQDAIVTGLSEEHGIIDLKNTSFRPRVGDRVRIIPNHVCVSVNLQDALLAIDGEELEFLPVLARGRQRFA